MATVANPEDLDIVNTSCPRGMQIEIAGYKKWTQDGGPPDFSLFAAVANIFCIVSGRIVMADEHFLKRITVLEFDPSKKYLKVKVV